MRREVLPARRGPEFHVAIAAHIVTVALWCFTTAMFLMAAQSCGSHVRTRLDAAVQFGAKMDPAR